MTPRQTLTQHWIPGGILIARESAVLALDIMETLEADGWGPLAQVVSLSEAQGLLDRTRPACALVDPYWRGAFQPGLVGSLQAIAVPFALITSAGYDSRLKDLAPGVRILAEPYQPGELVMLIRALLSQPASG